MKYCYGGALLCNSLTFDLGIELHFALTISFNFPFPECDLQNLTYHLMYTNMSSTKDVTSGAGSVYPFRAHEIIPSFWWGTFS